jgi:hypothetical protein
VCILANSRCVCVCVNVRAYVHASLFYAFVCAACFFRVSVFVRMRACMTPTRVGLVCASAPVRLLCLWTAPLCVSLHVEDSTGYTVDGGI